MYTIGSMLRHGRLRLLRAYMMFTVDVARGIVTPVVVTLFHEPLAIGAFVSAGAAR
jgi:hypothetical protein